MLTPGLAIKPAEIWGRPQHAYVNIVRCTTILAAQNNTSEIVNWHPCCHFQCSNHAPYKPTHVLQTSFKFPSK